MEEEQVGIDEYLEYFVCMLILFIVPGYSFIKFRDKLISNILLLLYCVVIYIIAGLTGGGSKGFLGGLWLLIQPP